MSTYHEMLAILKVAQESHEKPQSEGGHDSPLNLRCFILALRENARTLGYPPGYLLTQFRNKYAVLLKKGWIRICDERCGGDHFELTDAGYAQLTEWNQKGCIAHESGVGARAARNGRKCAGRARLKPPKYGSAVA